jgi:class 3 adenylate cyclase/pimeloyl-ACP methyl ester carboxylesterase
VLQQGEDLPVTRYVRTPDGLHIAYQVFGGGPIDLVFLSSWICQIEHVWAWPACARFFDRLSRFSRVITLDKRGSGLSDRVGTTSDVDERMGDVRTVMDAVGSERAALLGTSEGGALGAVFAATHPDRTIALIMAGSFARFRPAPDYPWGWDDDAFGLMDDYVENHWGTGGGAAIMAPDLADNEAFCRWYGQLERLAGSPGSMRAAWEWNTAIDIRSTLPAIHVPTLVLHRAGDLLVSVEHGRYLAEHIPNAKYVELDGSEHYAFIGDVDAFVDEVETFLTGAPAHREADRLLATVLFTDIVSSTERAAEVGDRRWHSLLDQHHSLVRQQVHSFGGREIKTIGDGVLATFDGPTRAIRCALAIREGLRPLGLKIRAGLHTGEVEVMGEDIGGMAVHIGQRVSALAAPDEILVSRTVVDLAVGSAINFDDRGETELKGVPGRWHLFAVTG